MRTRIIGTLAVVAAVASGCGTLEIPVTGAPAPVPEAPAQSRADSIADMMRRAHEVVPQTPAWVPAGTAEGRRIRDAALNARGLRIVVGTEARALWLMRDTTVLFRAPIAIGMEEGFTYAGKAYEFTTPLGRRRVLSKDTMPLWVPPDWHYYEIALEKDLEVVKLRKGRREKLADGSHLEIRGNEVGRVNEFGNFWAFTPGTEIIFDGRIYVPPFGTKQREIPDVLGTHKLAIGDGYLIHGTDQETSIGAAVSHGCVRMYNADVAWLHGNVPVGTAVFIY